MTLAALAAQATAFETPCGAGTMRWRSWGDGPPLVLVHGGSGSWRHWARNIGHLATHRRVIAPDLPGMGDSALPPAGAVQEDVAGIVADGLATILGDAASACDLVGFSFGGMVAGLVASLAGPRVRRLALVAPGGFGQPYLQPPRVRLRGLEGTQRRCAHRANLRSMMIAAPDRVDALALEIQEANTRLARMNGVFSRARAVLPPALARFAGPVHAIWGERDMFVGPNLAIRRGQLLAARPDASIRLLPEPGHWLQFEAPAEFHAWLAEALPLR